MESGRFLAFSTPLAPLQPSWAEGQDLSLQLIFKPIYAVQKKGQFMRYYAVAGRDNRKKIAEKDKRLAKNMQEVKTMKGYYVAEGYMGYVNGLYRLFADERDYLEYMEE